MNNTKLRIAIQKSGRLNEDSLQILKDAGISIDNGKEQLKAQARNFPLERLEVEKFWVLCLNRKNRLLKRVELTSGTATAALAHPREVFRAAIRESSTAIVCAHNHPSGDPAPSAPDMHVTRVIREASKAVDIDFIDHVIVGRPEADPLAKGYFSFREAGIL